MRTHRFAPFEHYHIFNRGIDERLIFNEVRDRARFLFLILYHQAPKIFFRPLGRTVAAFMRSGRFSQTKKSIDRIVVGRSVALINFCLMDNHFHLTIQELKEHGASRYLQRVLDAYTKYFNKKYRRHGHLFEGPFKSVPVESNTQLLHLSAYIHKNPTDIRGWRGRELEFPWSSGVDYSMSNRFPGLLKPDSVLGQFGADAPRQQVSYKKFIVESTAKSIRTSLSEEHCFVH